MGTAEGVPKEQEPHIQVKSLSYTFQDGSSGLQDVTLSLPPGSRTLLIGGTWSLSYLSIHVLTLSLTSSSEWRWKDHTAPPPVWQTDASYRHSQHRWNRSVHLWPRKRRLSWSRVGPQPYCTHRHQHTHPPRLCRR